MKSRFVVNRDLFARLNITQGDEKNMAIKNLHVTIWLTGVVNVVRAVAPFAAIEAPAIIDRADAESAATGSALGFAV